MKKKIFIIGQGGLGQSWRHWYAPSWTIRDCRFLWRHCSFWNHNNGITSSRKHQATCFNIRSRTGCRCHWRPADKQKIVSMLPELVQFPVIIHPSVVLEMRQQSAFGQGTVLTAGVKLTVDIELGSHVLVNLNSTIGHNTRIDDFCSIMLGLIWQEALHWANVSYWLRR